jgi:hypothetical protein
MLGLLTQAVVEVEVEEQLTLLVKTVQAVVQVW